MRALIVFAHPSPRSFTAAVRATVEEKLRGANAEIRVIDLYARNFDPRLTAEEFANYEDPETNGRNVRPDVEDIRWCDTLIFIYPTWWYGLPAILKGWLDRVFLPGTAFLMPDAENAQIQPALHHITRLGVFTTCGASWWLTHWIGAPGRRTLLRGVGLLCSPRCRTFFAAHYRMDSSTPKSRAAHLARVSRAMDRLVDHFPVRPVEAPTVLEV
ncbi:MAG: NAD(P)H-dependent oxidoreductase [Pseudomonadota bacterium]